MKNEENLIIWSPNFSIGIPAIDQEHMKLVRLCNNLYKSVLAEKAKDSPERKEAVKTALRECADYAKTHFKSEEKLMQQCDFQGIEKHRSEHKTFIKMILDKIQSFDKEDFASSLEFVRFLYDWILYHIAHTDTLYVEKLKEWHEKNP